MVLMKTCNKCARAFPLDAFPPNGGGTRRPECRDCLNSARRTRYRNNPESIKRRVSRYRERHPEAVKETNRKYHQANRTERNARASAYYIATYYPANRERLRTQQRAWAQRRPEMQLLKRMRRLTRQFSRPIRFGPQDWQRCYGAFGGRCAYCGAKATTGDHFIPLVSDDCPGTVPNNMIPACGPCNFSKSSRDPDAWLLKRLGTVDAAIRLTAIRAYLRSV